MTVIIESVQASEPDTYGYRQFTLGGFMFRRDEYFAHVTWAKYSSRRNVNPPRVYWRYPKPSGSEACTVGSTRSVTWTTALS